MSQLTQARKTLRRDLQALIRKIKIMALKYDSGDVNGWGAFLTSFRRVEAQLEYTIAVAERAENAATEARQQFELIFNMSPDATFITRCSDWIIVNCNEAFVQLTGYDRDTVLGGKTLDEYLHADGLVREGLLAVLQAGGVCDNLEVIYRKQDGAERTGQLSAKLISLHGVPHVVSIIRDITDRKQKEAEIVYLSYHDQLTGLYNRRFYEEELLRLDLARNLPITLVMADVNGLKMTNDAFGHAAGDQLLQALARIIKSACRSDDIVARIGGDEFVLLLPKTDSAAAEEIVRRIKAQVDACRIGHTVLSVSFGWSTKTSEADSMAQIYRQAEDHMYRKKLSESTSMKSETLRLITKTIYEKNAGEQVHSERVGRLGEQLALDMGLSADEASDMRTAGLMHDIGKVGVSKDVLIKEGRLTEAEWKEIRRHPETGYHILSAIHEFADIAQVILYHHERWDGAGYPKGLKGEAIPLMARMLAVVEAYDAIVSGVGKPPASVEAAVQELGRQAGRQFDAAVVEVFTKMTLRKMS